MTNREKTFLFMIIPALVLFVAFNTIPLITGAVYSFTNYRGYGDYDFVGIRNYVDLFGDELKLEKSFEKDPSNNYQDGLLELYKKIRPGEPLSVDSAQSLLNSICKKDLQAAVVRTKSFPQFFSHCL